MTIRYSIIIPVYNRPDELNELLESLQTCLGWKQQKDSETLTLKPGVSAEVLDTGDTDAGDTDDGNADAGYSDTGDADTGDADAGDTETGDTDAGDATVDAISSDKKGSCDVEVIVVEDGSQICSEDVCRHYTKTLNLYYIYQENAGPAAARNTGAQSARGEWLIYFDSDCLVPEGYFEAISSGISAGGVDFFGGPDRASSDFSAIQKAIDYAMTSFLTTGGIRGGKKKMDRYYPRSFNMGVRRDAFDKVGGFSGLRFGEDLDLSMRLMAAGYRSVLFEDAWVYHKRRTDLKKFFKQVYNSGMARIVLNQLHPGTLKTVHMLPTLFVCYLAAALVSIPMLTFILWVPIGILILVLFTDGLFSTGNLATALLVPAASLVQITGYGTGLAHAFILVHLLGKKEANAFKETFYK